MLKAVLFDLGNTLVRYFNRAENSAVLTEAMAEARGWVATKGLLHVAPEEIEANLAGENHEAPDLRVRPLEERLARVFALPLLSPDEAAELCRAFLAPIFTRASLYPDTLPILAELRRSGLKLAIVSNTPWGSPTEPWREELHRHGLDVAVDAAVFCRDAGWRKPDRRIFQYTLACLALSPTDCLFVGDDPRWDLAGPRAIGMPAVMIDRHGAQTGNEEPGIQTLHGIWPWLGRGGPDQCVGVEEAGSL